MKHPFSTPWPPITRKASGPSPTLAKQARGADPAVRAVLGDAVFLGDVLAMGGLDSRRRPRACCGAPRT
ncbi:hypothetical protein SBADM41S_07499 [Streptomyces badius]